MDRRQFIKDLVAMAALAPVTRIAAKAGADGDKSSDILEGLQVTRRPFRNTAQTVPLLGFGCMRLPTLEGGKIDIATVRKMVERAMKAGCNYFDTAYMYHGGQSERCMGEVLKAYPRDSFYLTDKMPVWSAQDAAGVERIFKEQLERCQTEYFDFYLVHSLNKANWDLAQKFKAYEFLSQMKKEGKIRRLGFSFHDTPEVLKTIIQSHEWDFCQIQLNYLDWDLYRSREQYEIAAEAGVPLVIMEPLRGGVLASLSPDATEILKKANPEASAASWAFRFVGSLPNVMCILSGMTRPEHLEDNIKTFSPLKPLTDDERKVLDEALLAYRKKLAVPCTACRYCMPCPFGVQIPRIFGIYNQYKASGNRWQFNSHYNSLPKSGRADSCVGCRRCVQHCPQKIQIPEMLAKIAEEVK